MRRIIGIALIVVLTALTGLADSTRDQLWQSYGAYTSPFLAELPRGATRQPMSPRVVVVLVRALRLAESRQMPTLNALRERGADITIELSPPAYRIPTIVGLLSGTRPETHGITTNNSPRLWPDTIFPALQTFTRTVAIVGQSPWGDWFDGNAQRFDTPDEAEPATRDGQAIDMALAAMRDPAQPAAFVLIELQLLEDVATNDPASYATAVAATDFRLKTLVDALDLSISTLVVVSDRGLTRVFHDGGDDGDVARVPMVMAGTGVAVGTQAIAPQTSIAPTLAALSGAPFPMHAQAGPVLSALVPNAQSAQLPLASAQQQTTFYERWSEVMAQPRFASELLRAYQPSLATGDAVATMKWQAELDAQANALIAQRLAGERTGRLPFVAGAALLVLVLMGLLLNSRPVQPLVGAGLYAVAWLGLFWIGRGDAFTLSLFPSGDPYPPLAELERNSAVLMGVVCVFVALATFRHEDAFDALTTVMCTLGLIALVNAGVFVWFYSQWGDAWAWTLPNSNALVLVMVALTQISAFSLTVSPTLPDVPIALPLR